MGMQVKRTGGGCGLGEGFCFDRGVTACLHNDGKNTGEGKVGGSRSQQE